MPIGFPRAKPSRGPKKVADSKKIGEKFRKSMEVLQIAKRGKINQATGWASSRSIAWPGRCGRATPKIKPAMEAGVPALQSVTQSKTASGVMR
ncbi:hypothetical protein RF55_17815 [Lasius niger]|uniref:Uncharacterized protein n=1 Tax=Lasius niger TaxID=67767 RepID=A0A0J7K2H0_LASNI|nr:hypothetical protein RF55_17815 [Lasius niger]